MRRYGNPSAGAEISLGISFSLTNGKAGASPTRQVQHLCFAAVNVAASIATRDPVPALHRGSPVHRSRTSSQMFGALSPAPERNIPGPAVQRYSMKLSGKHHNLLVLAASGFGAAQCRRS